MRFQLLPWIVETEGSRFQQVENRWRPVDLLFNRQCKVLIDDMEKRYQRIAAAEDELQVLERGALYLKLVKRMRVWLRQAHFTWRSNQLAFLQAVAGFYSDYGTVLRLLKFDQARGKFAEAPQVKGV